MPLLPGYFLSVCPPPHKSFWHLRYSYLDRQGPMQGRRLKIRWAPSRGYISQKWSRVSFRGGGGEDHRVSHSYIKTFPYIITSCKQQPTQKRKLLDDKVCTGHWTAQQLLYPVLLESKCAVQYSTFEFSRMAKFIAGKCRTNP